LDQLCVDFQLSDHWFDGLCGLQLHTSNKCRSNRFRRNTWSSSEDAWDKTSPLDSLLARLVFFDSPWSYFIGRSRHQKLSPVDLFDYKCSLRL
jgi:hypothetical protein